MNIQYNICMKKSAKGKHSSDRRLLIGPQTFKLVSKGGGGGICKRILASKKINICIICGENR